MLLPGYAASKGMALTTLESGAHRITQILAIAYVVTASYLTSNVRAERCAEIPS